MQILYLQFLPVDLGRTTNGGSKLGQKYYIISDHECSIIKQEIHLNSSWLHVHKKQKQKKTIKRTTETFL